MRALPAPSLDLPRLVLLAAIRFYKRFVSPHKGFACAYRIHTGHCSCSTLGYRAVARFGVLRGLGVLRLRLDRCHEVFLRHGRHRERGFVDCVVPCDTSCGLPDCHVGWCELLNCFDCGSCGGSDRGTRRRRAANDMRVVEPGPGRSP